MFVNIVAQFLKFVALETLQRGATVRADAPRYFYPALKLRRDMGADDRVLATGMGKTAAKCDRDVQIKAVVERHAKGTFTAVEGRTGNE